MLKYNIMISTPALFVALFIARSNYENVNTNIMLLDIIHRPVFRQKKDGV
jgi:hypothetical protein